MNQKPTRPDQTELLFLSGWGFDPCIFDSLRARLDSTWRCLPPVLPGVPPDVPPGASLGTEEAPDPSLPPRQVILAWSMGVLSGIRRAQRQPGQIQALVLLAGSPCFCQTAHWPAGLEQEQLRALEEELRADRAAALGRFSLFVAQGSPDRRRVLRTLRASLSQACLEDLIADLRCLASADLRAELQALRCPVYMLLGAQDALVPSVLGSACQALLPGLHLEVLEHCGHAPFLSHPHRVVELLRNARDAQTR